VIVQLEPEELLLAAMHDVNQVLQQVKGEVPPLSWRLSILV
jgi:hypothetical protein